MKVVHVETGRHLYGGGQQVLYLMQGLASRQVDGVLVCVAGSGIDDAARAAGLEVVNIRCAGDHDLRFAWRLRRVLTREKPDVVHCHSRRGADFLGGQAAAMAGVPAVVSRRVDNPEPWFQASLRYRKFRKVIAISEAIANMLREAGLEEDRLSVIRSAVDVASIEQASDREEFLAEFGLQPESFVIGAIGQLIPRKGHRYLQEALAGLADERSGLRLIIFGAGPLEGELTDQRDALGLSRRVQFAGFRNDLDRFMGNLDLVVHPALAEGLGVALLKAAAAGVPVVAFEAGGVCEAVADGETGTLVAPGDVAALQTAMAALIDDDAMRKRYGDAGRDRMQREFTVDVMADRHVELYDAVCRGQS